MAVVCNSRISHAWLLRVIRRGVGEVLQWLRCCKDVWEQEGYT